MQTDTKEMILHAFYQVADKKPIEKIRLIISLCEITNRLKAA